MSDAERAPKFLLDDAVTPAEAEATSGSELKQLEDLVDAFVRQTSVVDDLTEELKAETEKLRRLGQDEIPSVMLQHGFSELRLKSGKKVIVKENVSVSVPPEKQSAFFEFLRRRNEQDIIKLHVHFDRMSDAKLEELMTFLDGYEYAFTSDRGVHPQTLKAYTTKLLALDMEPEERAEAVASGRALRKEDVAGVMNAFTFFSTKVK